MDGRGVDDPIHLEGSNKMRSQLVEGNERKAKPFVQVDNWAPTDRDDLPPTDFAGSRQGKFICITQFRHKATQSALQAHTNYIKKQKVHLKDIAFKRQDNCIKKTYLRANHTDQTTQIEPQRLNHTDRTTKIKPHRSNHTG